VLCGPPLRGARSICTSEPACKVRDIPKADSLGHRCHRLVRRREELARCKYASFDDPHRHRATRLPANDRCEMGRGVMQGARDMREADPVSIVFVDEASHSLNEAVSIELSRGRACKRHLGYLHADHNRVARLTTIPILPRRCRILLPAVAGLRYHAAVFALAAGNRKVYVSRRTSDRCYI